jgi:hypothetical protein
MIEVASHPAQKVRTTESVWWAKVFAKTPYAVHPSPILDATRSRATGRLTCFVLEKDQRRFLHGGVITCSEKSRGGAAIRVFRTGKVGLLGLLSASRLAMKDCYIIVGEPISDPNR